jgi:hypothetical protein
VKTEYEIKCDGYTAKYILDEIVKTGNNMPTQTTLPSLHEFYIDCMPPASSTKKYKPTVKMGVIRAVDTSERGIKAFISKDTNFAVDIDLNPNLCAKQHVAYHGFPIFILIGDRDLDEDMEFRVCFIIYKMEESSLPAREDMFAAEGVSVSMTFQEEFSCIAVFGGSNFPYYQVAHICKTYLGAQDINRNGISGYGSQIHNGKRINLPKNAKFHDVCPSGVKFVLKSGKPAMLHELIDLGEITEPLAQLILDQADLLEKIAKAYRVVATGVSRKDESSI